jgi:drug/metabolite transporter (DMT)-like permease
MSASAGRPAVLRSGIVFAVLAMACFAVMDVTNKVLVAGMPLLMALWFRYIFQAVVTTVVVLPRRGWALFHTRQPWRHLLRGVLLFLCSLLAFINLQHMPVAEFTAIGMLTPLAVTVVARFVLREHVTPLRWLLIVGAMVGALLIVQPGSQMSLSTAWLPLVMVAVYASFQILTSLMARTEEPVTLHFYTGWIGTAIASCLVLGWWTTDLSFTQWAQLLVLGVAGTLGHYLLILAFARSPASRVTPFLYTGIAFATFGGWLVFSHVPNSLALLGMLLIVGCGLLAGWVTLREQRLNPTS